MKDAVGSTMLVYIVIIVVGMVGSILIASNMYTSAYKAKNNIISEINRYYMVNSNSSCFNDDTCTKKIELTLKNMGYHVSSYNCNKYKTKVEKKAYDKVTGELLGYPKTDNPIDKGKGYCVFKTNLSSTEYYYTVVTFSHLNVNVFSIGSLFSTPVYGETRIYSN